MVLKTKSLVIIPARGGSKGVPGKNIKKLKNKPLIYYSLDAARGIFNDDQICVSTDNLEIKKIIELKGIKVPFLRPANLATDTSSTLDVILHAYRYFAQNGFSAETIVLLQPTSPFRTSQHRLEALNLETNNCDMVVSVKETKANPYFNLFEENEKGFLQISKSGSFTRRQDCPKVWEYNGAIYIINVKSLMSAHSLKFDRIKKYVMDDYSSHDIDSNYDWKMAEIMMDK